VQPLSHVTTVLLASPFQQQVVDLEVAVIQQLFQATEGFFLAVVEGHQVRGVGQA